MKNFTCFEEILLFIQILLLVTILPAMLRLLSLHRLFKLLTPSALKVCNHQNIERRRDTIVKFADYIFSWEFWIYKGTCLKRSLVLYHFLRKLGIIVRVCFGVRYDEKFSDREAKRELEAHAWLVYQGKVYLEKTTDFTESYKVIYCFPDKTYRHFPQNSGHTERFEL